MQIRHMRVRRPGRDEQDGAAWGDERQVAVWGQVSARTLYLAVMLQCLGFGVVFYVLNRFGRDGEGPCLVVGGRITGGMRMAAGPRRYSCAGLP